MHRSAEGGPGSPCGSVSGKICNNEKNKTTSAAAQEGELGFQGKALMSCQSKHEGRDSDAVWERNSCFSHLPRSGATFLAPERRAVTVHNQPQLDRTQPNVSARL